MQRKTKMPLRLVPRWRRALRVVPQEIIPQPLNRVRRAACGTTAKRSGHRGTRGDGGQQETCVKLSGELGGEVASSFVACLRKLTTSGRRFAQLSDTRHQRWTRPSDSFDD